MSLVALAACVDSGTVRSVDGAEVVAFESSAPSLEHLGEAVLSALSRGDIQALEAFRLTEVEHNEVVWPELPAAAPEVNFPVDMAWSNIQARNRSAIARIVPLFEGRRSSYRGTECRGAAERFETYLVLQDCWIVFELEDPSDVFEVQAFKDVLVRSGGHKVFRYYDEEPRSRLALR